MALFLSTFLNRLDKKARVSVPAGFRAALAGQHFQGVVLFRSATHPCIEGFGMDRMEEMGARLDAFDMFSSEQDDLATAIFSDAVQVPFDGEGRMVLPPALIEFAQLEDQAAFVGLGTKFQIWNPGLFDQRQAEAREKVKSQGLTLPKGPA